MNSNIIEENVMKNEENKFYYDPEGGWTFIETIIVIGIVLVLTSSVGFMAIKYLDRAKVVTARSQIETFSISLDAYFLDCGEYPSESQGLAALWEAPDSATGGLWSGPYVNKSIPKDPWGNDYEYRKTDGNSIPYLVLSWGRDGVEGGAGNDADISSRE
ncbi:MAG: type II secretion system major pseudopilin GspG [Treponema sp.]|jgi:general secretion pathway protein G|nr:type II secretion system major pseudopilin GspG [Treponema sp.]